MDFIIAQSMCATIIYDGNVKGIRIIKFTFSILGNIADWVKMFGILRTNQIAMVSFKCTLHGRCTRIWMVWWIFHVDDKEMITSAWNLDDLCYLPRSNNNVLRHCLNKYLFACWFFRSTTSTAIVIFVKRKFSDLIEIDAIKGEGCVFF